MNWQKIGKDLGLATSAHFFDKFAGYLILMMLTRYLSKDQMGAFFFAATLASFFAIFTELGTNQYLIREAARNPSNALDNFSEIVSLRLPLIFLCFITLNSFTLIFKPELFTMMLFTSVYYLLEDFYYTFSALFLGLKHVGVRVMTSVTARGVLVGLIFSVISFGGSLYTVLICYVLANVILVSFAIVMTWKRIGHFKISWSPTAFRKVLRTSTPLFILAVLSLIHFKVDTLMLGFLGSYLVVATYEAGFKLLEVSRFIIRPAVMIFFPICSELAAQQNWSELKSLLRKMLVTTGGLGVVVTLGVILMAQVIVSLVFGPKYTDSTSVLRVLYLSIPALYIGMIGAFLANALHLERKAIKIMVISVGINIVLNSISIPAWGAVGAAWTTLVSETFLTVCLIGLIIQQLWRLSTGEPKSIWVTLYKRPLFFTKKSEDASHESLS